MKRIILVYLISLTAISLCAQVQRAYIYKDNSIVYSLPVSEMDSIVFKYTLSSPSYCYVFSADNLPFIYWSAVQGADYYEIWRSGDGVSFSCIAKVNSDCNFYTDTNPLNTDIVYYKVRAISELVDGEFSAVCTYKKVETPGVADNINYSGTVTEDEFDNAVSKLNFVSIMTAQKCMRGGKEENYPGEHAYQRQYTLTDIYAEYAVVPHYDHAYASYLNYSYSLSRDWYVGPFGQYGLVRSNIVPLLINKAIDTIPELKALSLLLFDYSSIEVSDIYGPIPFTAFLNNQDQPPYSFDALSDIYAKVFIHLDKIIACLHAYDNRPDWYKENVQKILDSYFIISKDWRNGRNGMATWIKFANSLKLRMAMHMVKVQPDLAKQYAEEAVADGVIDSEDDELGFWPTTYSGRHPLYDISETWNDERLNASFESILMSLQHPYGRALFNKNGGQLGSLAADTRVVGIRSGLHTGAGQVPASNPFVNYSRLRPTMIQKAPLYIFKWSEIDFLRAEGALRGWNMGGTAQFFYERGIDNSSCLDPSSVAHANLKTSLIPDYKEVASATAYTYIDPLGNSEDMESVTKIGVKWNDADDNETKLEKIITQKYIAIFPNSFEAWGEMRRTGYPKTFPVLNPDQGDGSLQYGDLVRRMIFPYDDDASIQEIQKTGLPALLKDNPQSMGDKQGTRLWWDKEGSNF